MRWKLLCNGWLSIISLVNFLCQCRGTGLHKQRAVQSPCGAARNDQVLGRSCLSASHTNFLQMRETSPTLATIKSERNPRGAARTARLEQYELFLLQVLDRPVLPNNALPTPIPLFDLMKTVLPRFVSGKCVLHVEPPWRSGGVQLPLRNQNNISICDMRPKGAQTHWASVSLSHCLLLWWEGETCIYERFGGTPGPNLGLTVWLCYWCPHSKDCYSDHMYWHHQSTSIKK